MRNAISALIGLLLMGNAMAYDRQPVSNLGMGPMMPRSAPPEQSAEEMVRQYLIQLAYNADPRSMRSGVPRAEYNTPQGPEDPAAIADAVERLRGASSPYAGMAPALPAPQPKFKADPKNQPNIWDR